MSFKTRLHLYFRCDACQHKSSLKDMKQWETSEKTNLEKGTSSRSKVAAPRGVFLSLPCQTPLESSKEDASVPSWPPDQIRLAFCSKSASSSPAHM